LHDENESERTNGSRAYQCGSNRHGKDFLAAIFNGTRHGAIMADLKNNSTIKRHSGEGRNPDGFCVKTGCPNIAIHENESRGNVKLISTAWLSG
jgi:hypothetical protein